MAGRLPIVVAVLLLSSACQVSRYAARGDAAWARGEYAVALADYRAAIDEERQDTRDVLDRRDRAAVRVAATIIELAERRAAAGEFEAAIESVNAIVAAEGWGSLRAHTLALDALRTLAAGQLQRAGQGLAQNDFEGAVQLIRGVLAVVPGSDVEKEATALLIDIQQRLLASAERAPPNTRLFRLRLAERYGAAVGKDGDGPREHGFVVRWTGPAACAPFIPNVPPASEAVDADTFIVEVLLTACQTSETTTPTQEIYRSESVVAQTRETEVAHYETRPLDPRCNEPMPCRRFDSLGVCVARDEAPACLETERVLVTKPTTVVDYVTETATASRTVHIRTLGAQVHGAVQVRRGDQVEVEPLAIDLSATDRAYWSPHEQRHYTKQLVHLVRQAKTEVQRRALERGRVAVGRLAAARRTAVAAQGGDGLEHHIVLALLSGSALDEAGEAYFRERYGLGPIAVQDTLRRRPFAFAAAPPSPARLPLPESSRWEANWIKAAVRGPEDASTHPSRTPGLDVGARVEGSPLASSSRAHTVFVRLVSRDIHLGLSASNRNLGGDVGGFSGELLVLFDDFVADDLTFVWGVRYESTQNDRGEGTRFLGAPIELRLALGSVLQVNAGIDLNIFFLKAAFDRDPADPRFVVPLYAGATVNVLRWLFVGGRVVHYFEGAAGEALHAGGWLGVRL